jgi:hypothetical protein
MKIVFNLHPHDKIEVFIPAFQVTMKQRDVLIFLYYYFMLS